jgi:hypothetical protein
MILSFCFRVYDGSEGAKTLLHMVIIIQVRVGIFWGKKDNHCNAFAMPIINHKHEITISWCGHDKGFVKLDVDGSSQGNSKKIGFGGFIRNNKGK